MKSASHRLTMTVSAEQWYCIWCFTTRLQSMRGPTVTVMVSAATPPAQIKYSAYISSSESYYAQKRKFYELITHLMQSQYS